MGEGLAGTFELLLGKSKVEVLKVVTITVEPRRFSSMIAVPIGVMVIGECRHERP